MMTFCNAIMLFAAHESDGHSGGPVSSTSLVFNFLLMTMAFLPLIPFLVPIFYFWSHSRSWTPTQTGRRPAMVGFEVLTLLFGVVFVVILWIYTGSSTFVPVVFSDEFSAAIRNDYKWGLILGSGLTFASLFIARRWNTSLAVGLLLGFGFVGATTLNAKISNQRSLEWSARHSTRARAGAEDVVIPPIKMRFELVDNIPGAKLWINDEYLGTTPYETTAQELFQKISEWSEERRRKIHDRKIPGNQYQTPQGKTLNQWGWCPVHLPSGMRPDYQLYFRVELNGTDGYSRMSSMQADGVHDDPKTTHIVKLDTVFPKWEESIEMLLDQLRLNDYEVNEEWLEVFASYGGGAEKQIQQALQTEPELKAINEFRARQKWDLQTVNDAESAWRKLLEISAKAGRGHRYDSQSIDGVAVDLLVPSLAPQQLVDYAIKLLKVTPNPDPKTRSYNQDGFATYHDGGEQYGNEVALWPIAQAIGRLDQRLDTERENSKTPLNPLTSHNLFDAIHPEDDNLVERQLTPVIMQLAYTAPHRIEYAEQLGGSLYEQFLLRNDWRTPATDVFNGDAIGNYENYVNKWFVKLMNLRTPLGNAFRRQQNDQLLKIARNAFSEHSLHSPALPRDLEFLFLEQHFTEKSPSLAMKFWLYLDGFAKSAPDHASHQILNMRWDYLGRIWPESTPKMFLDALREGIDAEEHLSIPYLTNTIPARDRFEILSMMIAAETERVEKLPDPPKSERYSGPKYQGQQIISRLHDQVIRLDAKPAAHLLLSEMKEDSKSSWWQSLPRHMEHNKEIDALLDEVVVSDDPEIQKMAITPIVNHPTPDRRKLLQTLLDSENQAVRATAEQGQYGLEELKQMPVQKRSLEQFLKNTTNE